MALTPEQYGPLIGIAIAVPLILLRNRRPRPLNVRWMWVVPLLVVLMIGTGVFIPHDPFGPFAYAGMTAALLAGCAFGWWRGRMVAITRDPATGGLMAQASPLGLVLILALFGVRYALRGYLDANAEDWRLNVGALTDGFMLFAAGLVVTQRVEMWLRARALGGKTPDAAAA